MQCLLNTTRSTIPTEPNTPDYLLAASTMRLGLAEFGCDFSSGVHELADIIVRDLCFSLQMSK
jgi:hypothetical protein